MEIALYAELDEPYLERLEHGRVRVHADINQTIEGLLDKFAELGSEQLEVLKELWVDAAKTRKFTNGGDYVLISPV